MGKGETQGPFYVLDQSREFNFSSLRLMSLGKTLRKDAYRDQPVSIQNVTWQGHVHV